MDDFNTLSREYDRVSYSAALQRTTCIYLREEVGQVPERNDLHEMKGAFTNILYKTNRRSESYFST